jgi:hypothetical protein
MQLLCKGKGEEKEGELWGRFFESGGELLDWRTVGGLTDENRGSLGYSTNIIVSLHHFFDSRVDRRVISKWFLCHLDDLVSDEILYYLTKTFAYIL